MRPGGDVCPLGISLRLPQRRLPFPPVNAPAHACEKSEKKIVGVICLLAVLHVLIFTAAFPFFNSVDELLHFDLVTRYARGDFPRQPGTVSVEASYYLARFHSFAYMSDPAWLPHGQVPPPIWKQPPETGAAIILDRETEWQKLVNPETTMPPLYYLIAGAWWNIGKAACLRGEWLLYWLRFLNVLVVTAVVWLGWRTARKIFPENIFTRLAVPALIAGMPQTAFYAINSDILTPLFFGGAFLLLLKFETTEIFPRRLGIVLGLTLAGTFLTKTSTLPLLAVAAGFIAVKIFRLARAQKFQAAAPALSLLLVCAVLPVTAWMLWCKIYFGDLTGSTSKISELGWTSKPLMAWFTHPLFTPAGLWIFVGDTFSTFWQGEFYWRHKPLAIPALDIFYAMFTSVFLLLAFLAARIIAVRAQRQPLQLALACLAMTFAFFAVLSVKFDFHDCFYPSRAYPFFTSGRLFLGGLIPIMILIATGLDFALQKCPHKVKFAVLAALLIFMVAGETAVDWPVFPSAYNAYHL